MTLNDFLRTAKGERSTERWALAVADASEANEEPPSRQALEHYVRGARVPEPAIFRMIVRESGRPDDDREAWGAWAVAKGAPAGLAAPGAA